MLPASAAHGTWAADRFVDRLAAVGLWLLGCLVAAAAAFSDFAHGTCLPSVYSDAFPHSPLGGWTPCVASVMLTGLPWILTTVYCLRKYFRQCSSSSSVHSNRNDYPTAATIYYFCPLMVALGALLVIRVLHVKYDPDFKLWQFVDNFDMAMIIREVLMMSLGDRRIICKQRNAWRLGGRAPSAGPVLLVAAVLLADIVKTMLLVRFPWQPVTDANKALPLMGALNAGGFILEGYLLLGAALFYYLPLTAVAADSSSITLKKPLLAEDSAAAVTDDAAAGDVAAKCGPAAAEAVLAEP